MLVSKICLVGMMLISFVSIAEETAEDFSAPELGHQLQPVVPAIPAANFALQDLDGELHTLDQYRGRVVMLNFWASWCPPCRREMPSMEAVYQGLKNDGLIVLAVNEWEDEDHVFAFMGQLSVIPEFPILFDQQGSTADKYSVQGLPTTLVINRNGQVVYRAIGGRDFEHPEVVLLLRGLLREKNQGDKS